jgi:hypothetical protein
MSVTPYTDEEAARALVHVLGGTTWEAVTLARGYIATLQGTDIEDAARQMYPPTPSTGPTIRTRTAPTPTNPYRMA